MCPVRRGAPGIRSLDFSKKMKIENNKGNVLLINKVKHDTA